MKTKLTAFLILLLLIFVSSSYATVSKEILLPTGLAPRLASQVWWTPVHASSGTVVYMETFEALSTYNSGLDNADWALTAFPESTYADPDEVLAHTGFGNQVLDINSAGSLTTIRQIEKTFSPTYATAYVRFYLRVHAWPAAVSIIVQLKDTAGTSRMRVRLSATSGHISLDHRDSTWTNDDYAISADTWYCIEGLWNITGTNEAMWKVNGTPVSTSTTNLTEANFASIIIGKTESTSQSYNFQLDDFIVGTGAYIDDWSMPSILTDASSSTYFIGSQNGTIGDDLTFTYAAPTPGADEVKGIRGWNKYIQASSALLRGRNGLCLGACASVNRFITDYKFSAGTSEKLMYWEYWKNPLTAAVWAWTGTDELDDVVGWCKISGTQLDEGAKVTEAWAEVIKGADGDAYVTHGPTFGYATSSLITAWVKIAGLDAGQSTNVRLRYDVVANEATVKGGGGSYCSDGSSTGKVVSANTADATTIFTCTGLSANTTYVFDVDVQQADDSWVSTYDFEYNDPAATYKNTYWTNLPRCTTSITEGSTDNWKFAAGGDQHDASDLWQIWPQILADAPAFFLQNGDLFQLDNDTYTGATGKQIIREATYFRKGAQSQSAYSWENVWSRMPSLRVWSDWDSMPDNANKIGGGGKEFGEGLLYQPMWKTFDVFRETTPIPTLLGPEDHYRGQATSGSGTTLLDTSSKERQFVYTVASGTESLISIGDTVTWNAAADTGTVIYVDTDDNIVILSLDEEGDALDTDDVIVDSDWSVNVDTYVYQFPTVSKYGIYKGMVVHHYTAEGTAEAYGIVKSNSGTTVTLCYTLCDDFAANEISCTGTTQAFANNDYYVIQRAFLGYKYIYGNAEFIFIDARTKRSPNRSRGADKMDGTDYPFFNEDAAYALSKDLTGANDFNDYLSAQTGTTTTLIKHNINDITNKIVKWDMVCAWDSADTALKGCSLVKNLSNNPTGSIKYFGSATTVADGGTSAVQTQTITPPASMLSGDLVVMQGRARATTGTLTMTETGGQTWTAGIQQAYSNTRTKIWYATFNGTWSGTNPTVDFGSAINNTLVMHVIRPSFVGNTWALDNNSYMTTGYTAPATPYTVCNPGVISNPATCNVNYSTLHDDAVVIAIWASPDDNTWGNLASADPGDTGWTKCTATSSFCTGTQSAQYRNMAGSDGSQSFAFLSKADIGTIGTVTQTQLTNGGDGGTRFEISFYENNPNPTFGNCDLEWEIPGLVATDRIRFFESGGSIYSSDKLAINAGHVQRTMQEIEIRDATQPWVLPVSETPLLHDEAANGVNYDKWCNYDGNVWWQEHTSVSSLGANLYATATDSYPTKPGGLFRYIAETADISAGYYPLYYLPTDPTRFEQFTWDSTNHRVIVNTNTDIGVTYPLTSFHTNYWERTATRRYITDRYANLNRIWIGKDRHFEGFDDRSNTADPWFHVNLGTLVDKRLGAHPSNRHWYYNTLAAWRHGGGTMWWGTTNSLAAYNIFDVQNDKQLINCTFYERDGSVLSNAASLHTDDLIATDAVWKGNMSFDIAFVCPYGMCDYFNRTDGTSLGADWTEDNAYLSINTNRILADADNIGIAHLNDATETITQFHQVKISTVSTDGDIGVILRSPADDTTTDYRYAIVYDEGAQLIKFQQYNWNTYDSLLDSEAANLSDVVKLSVTIQGTGASTIANVWVSSGNRRPYDKDHWDDITDTPDYILTGSGLADTGLYGGIIIKKETGVTSPTLDDFYLGDATVPGGNYYPTGIMRSILRGVMR